MYKRPRECWKLIDFEAVRLGGWYTLFRWNETKTCSRLDPLADSYVHRMLVRESVSLVPSFACRLYGTELAAVAAMLILKASASYRGNLVKYKKSQSFILLCNSMCFFSTAAALPMLLSIRPKPRSNNSENILTQGCLPFLPYSTDEHRAEKSDAVERATKYNIQHYKFCAHSECTTESECRKTQSYIIKCYFEFSEMHNFQSFCC